MSDHVPTLIADGEIHGPSGEVRYNRPEGVCLIAVHALRRGPASRPDLQYDSYAVEAFLPDGREIPVPEWPPITDRGEAVARAMEALDDELGPVALETPTPVEHLAGDGLPPAEPLPAETRIVTPQHALGRRMGMMGFDRASGLAFCERVLGLDEGSLPSRNELDAADVAAVGAELDALERMRQDRSARASDPFYHPAAYRLFAAEVKAARKAAGIRTPAEAA